MRPRRLLVVAVVVAIAGMGACGGRRERADTRVEPAPATAASQGEPGTRAAVAPEARTAPASAVTRRAIDRAAVERAIAALEAHLYAPAGDPDNPWALAHGLLAFGKDFQTRDGKSAVSVAASFAQRGARAPGRYGFALERAGKPVEPHAHLLLKTFLEVGVPSTLPLRAADGTPIDVRRLLADMRASVKTPQSDAEWHDSAWWLAALELGDPGGGGEREQLREAALARLELDDMPLTSANRQERPPAPRYDPFAPDAPLGRAKRNKLQIYGHPCGGLHFVQAVMRAAAASRASDAKARVRRQIGLLLSRYSAERGLYADAVRSHPEARLVVSGQQLKFFGHLLETLALADELGLLRDDRELGARVGEARRDAAADVLTTLAQLDAERAYERLAEIAASRRQLYLDLVGDGCHALHGLRVTLPVLAEP